MRRSHLCVDDNSAGELASHLSLPLASSIALAPAQVNKSRSVFVNIDSLSKPMEPPTATISPPKAQVKAAYVRVFITYGLAPLYVARLLRQR